MSCADLHNIPSMTVVSPSQRIMTVLRAIIMLDITQNAKSIQIKLVGIQKIESRDLWENYPTPTAC